MAQTMFAAIRAHRAAWQAFQDAPADEAAAATEEAYIGDLEAMQELLSTPPSNPADLMALHAHLRWYTVEEAQREASDPAPFACYRALSLALGMTPADADACKLYSALNALVISAAAGLDPRRCDVDDAKALLAALAPSYGKGAGLPPIRPVKPIFTREHMAAFAGLQPLPADTLDPAA